MRTMFLLVVLASAAAAQKEKPPPLSKKAADQLKKITAKITEVTVGVQAAKDGFINTKYVANEVYFEPIESVVAGKPIAAKVRWSSAFQESKIYPTKEGAEKADEWLKPGKVAANPIAFTKPVVYVATYYYANEVWELVDLSWGAHSIAKGNKTKWTAVTGEVAKPKK